MTTLTPGKVEIRPITGRVGAQIKNLDVRCPLEGRTRGLVLDALYRYQVIFFEPQAITDTQQVEFASQFGEVTNPINPGLAAARPEIYSLASKVDKWHADTTWMERPPAAQVLRVITLPPVGGDTVFASTEAAYERLSAPLRLLVDGLWAVHDESRILYPDDRHSDERRTRVPREHPLVRVHPVSGRRSLFVNPLYTNYIVGLSSGESAGLLQLLYEHILQPEHIVRYRWSVGSIGIWDNRTTWHYAVDDYGQQPRKIHRVSLKGEIPVGPGGAIAPAERQDT
jgi:taurine dioxygenase